MNYAAPAYGYAATAPIYNYAAPAHAAPGRDKADIAEPDRRECSI